MWTRIWQFLWPRMGWRRYATYLRHRLVRMPGTSHSVAIGFAAGAAMSMTPFMGFHFILSAAFAWFLRGNILASAVGTIIGNPWTFPMIWVGTYEIGCLMLGIDAHAISIRGHTVAEVMHDPWGVLSPVLLPMVLGSVPAGVVVFFAAYWPAAKIIDRYKRQRMERRHRRALAMMERMTAASGGGIEERNNAGQD